MTATSNINGLKEIWYRNVAADGTIANVEIDGLTPSPANVVTQLGLTHYRIPFGEPLKKGQQIGNRVTYDLIDSFVKNSEAMIHVVNQKTLKLRLSVYFPAGRLFKRAKFTELYGGAKAQILKEIGNSGSEEKLEVEIEYPKLGASYELRWDW
jgi:hypothetical protein